MWNRLNGFCSHSLLKLRRIVSPHCILGCTNYLLRHWDFHSLYPSLLPARIVLLACGGQRSVWMLSEFGHALLLYSITIAWRYISSVLNGSVPGHVKPFITANLTHGEGLFSVHSVLFSIVWDNLYSIVDKCSWPAIVSLSVNCQQNLTVQSGWHAYKPLWTHHKL